MLHNRIIEPFGFILAIASLVFSFFFFTSDNAEPMGSLFAAVMTAGLVWVSYVILRWFYLALRG